MAKTKNGQIEPTVIKKYANRRLYDTGRSSYVTLDDLCEMVKEGIDFVVYDAKSGKDLTRSVLTQIILDQETKGEDNLLPIGFLKNLISFYGDSIQGAVPNYLEQALEAFVQNQEEMREHITKSFEEMQNMQGMFSPMANTPDFEEVGRKNMEVFENAMKMFMPFGNTSGAKNKEKEQK